MKQFAEMGDSLKQNVDSFTTQADATYHSMSEGAKSAASGAQGQFEQLYSDALQRHEGAFKLVGDAITNDQVRSAAHRAPVNNVPFSTLAEEKLAALQSGAEGLKDSGLNKLGELGQGIKQSAEPFGAQAKSTLEGAQGQFDQLVANRSATSTNMQGNNLEHLPGDAFASSTRPDVR